MHLWFCATHHIYTVDVSSTAKKTSTPSHSARVRYLDAGLRVLADQGHAGLKLATVCEVIGATTGSFYHAFSNWPAYTSALIHHWREKESRRPIAEARTVTDPVARLQFLTDIAMRLPHDTEAAIRVWAEHDPDVRAVQDDADDERRRFISDTYLEVVGNRADADHYATAAMYLLVGYENGTLRSRETLEWAFQTFIEQALRQAGRIAETTTQRKTSPPSISTA